MKKEKNKQIQKAGMIKKHFVAFAALLLLVMGFIAYSNSFDASFHWDDITQIVENETIHDPANFLDTDNWRKVNMRPVSRLTLAWNYALGGNDVTGYHIVNLLFHILTAFLVFILARLSIGLLAGDERLDQRLKDVSALLIALLFLLHPLQTMAVTYIIQRMTILAALFYIVSVILYALGRRQYLVKGKIATSSILITLAVLSGILGVLSKQNAATFPAAFILYEVFFIRRTDGKMCRKYVISAVIVMIIAFMIISLSGRLPAENITFSRMEYLSGQFGIFYKYLLLLVLPFWQNVDHFVRLSPPLIGGSEIVGIILILGLLGLGVYLFKKNKLISFGIFWFLITMSVESSIIPIRDIMMEHRMYLPIFGVGMVIAGLVMRHVPYRSLTTLNIVGAVIILLLAFGTFNRNKVWKTDLSLWEDSYGKNPENPRAMNNLGLAVKINARSAESLQQRNADLNRAIKLFTESMAGDTIFVQAYMNRGLAYFELENYRKAMQDINTVIENKPEEKYLKYYIEGVALAKQGHLDAALERLDMAAGMNRDFAPLFLWRGLVNKEMGNIDAAISNYTTSVKIDPTQGFLCSEISDIYYSQRDHVNALYWLKKARSAGEDIPERNIELLEESVENMKQPLN